MRQLTQIEQRQTRIRQIRQKLNVGKSNDSSEAPASRQDIGKHYEVGKSQNHPEDIFPFLQKDPEDPAVLVCSANFDHSGWAHSMIELFTSPSGTPSTSRSRTHPVGEA